MNESASCYNGDTIMQVIDGGKDLIVVCTNSMYVIDKATAVVVRIL